MLTNQLGETWLLVPFKTKDKADISPAVNLPYDTVYVSDRSESRILQYYFVVVYGDHAEIDKQNREITKAIDRAKDSNASLVIFSHITSIDRVKSLVQRSAGTNPVSVSVAEAVEQLSLKLDDLLEQVKVGAQDFPDQIYPELQAYKFTLGKCYIKYRFIPGVEYSIGSTQQEMDELLQKYPEIKANPGILSYVQSEVRRKAEIITLSDFSISEQPVTVDQYQCYFPKYRPLSSKEIFACVTWDQALEFTEWQSQQSNTKISLPSELEWECVVKSGLITPTGREWCRSVYRWEEEGGLPTNFVPYPYREHPSRDEIAPTGYKVMLRAVRGWLDDHPSWLQRPEFRYGAIPDQDKFYFRLVKHVG